MLTWMGGSDLVQMMTFMYFTVAHQGDGEITDDEMRKARDFTLRYSGNFPNFEYNFTKACEWYDRAINGGSDLVFKQYSVNVGALLDQQPEANGLRQQIYDDLLEIARADGEISVGEKAILDETANAWGLI